MSRLGGKTAIVTGGAGGMGRAYAHRLAELGADVAILDIDLEVAKRWGEELTHDSVAEELVALGVRALAIEVDLSQRESTHAAIDAIAREFGRIDIVVHNAGGAVTPFDRSAPSTCPPEDVEKLLGANLMSTIHVCQAVTPHLKAQGGGSIINITTAGIDADNIAATAAIYRAAKAATLRFSRSLAVELGPYGIRVNCISPGIITTARIRKLAAERNVGNDGQAAAIPLRRLGTVDDVLGAMEFLASEMSSYVTGEVIRITGGLTLVTQNI